VGGMGAGSCLAARTLFKRGVPGAGRTPEAPGGLPAGVEGNCGWLTYGHTYPQQFGGAHPLLSALWGVEQWSATSLPGKVRPSPPTKLRLVLR
jgi:hypothetical protein